MTQFPTCRDCPKYDDGMCYCTALQEYIDPHTAACDSDYPEDNKATCGKEGK